MQHASDDQKIANDSGGHGRLGWHGRAMAQFQYWINVQYQAPENSAEPSSAAA